MHKPSDQAKMAHLATGLDRLAQDKWRFRLVGDPAMPPGYSAWAGHHYYWGIIMMTLGFAILFPLPRSQWAWCVPPILIGLHWIIDDIYQHIRQKWEPTYVSPVHRWYWWVLTWMLTSAKPWTWWWELLMWMRRH